MPEEKEMPHRPNEIAVKWIESKYARKTNRDYESILSFYHSIGSPIDGAHPGPKTDRDNLGRYCP